MRTLRSRRSVVALVGLIALTVGATGLTATSASAQEVSLVGVTFTPSEVDVSTGFGSVSVDLALRSDQPIPDTFGECDIDLTDSVFATAVEGSRPWLAAGEWPVGAIGLRGGLTRVSGSATDGVWRTTAATEVSPAWTGTWAVSSLSDPFNCSSFIEVGPLGALVVGSPERPPWKVMPAYLAPTKVVTGTEIWTPRVRVTDRLTGAGIPAFMNEPCDSCVFSRSARVSPRNGRDLPRADSAGYWTLQPRMVNDFVSGIVEAWGKRGTRGYSLESQGCVFSPWVKWQANQRIATSGRAITITGNAFPAPSIHRAANPWIHFQVLNAGRWTTVTSAVVRDNGRYTLTWTAPSAGTFHVRAYKPGGGAGCRTSSGTVLSTVAVVVR